MEEPRQPESLSSCRNVSDVAYYVRNRIELCIQNYMSLEVTAKYLEKNHRISKSVTHIVWEQLREENPLFFSHFEMRCKTAFQMRMFNDMLPKQAVRMFENGLIDICDASPSVKALLRREDPERVHRMETLASKRKLSSASLAMPYANCPSVAQTQILSNQQEQVLNPASLAMPNPSGPSAAQRQIPDEQLYKHLYASKLALSDANGISVPQLPIPYDQQDQHLYTTNLPLPYANGQSETQLPIPNNQQEQHLYATSLPLPVANGPSMTQLPMPSNQENQPYQDPSSAYNGHICKKKKLKTLLLKHMYESVSYSFPVGNSLGDPAVEPADTENWMLLFDPKFADLGDLPPLPPEDTNPWPSSSDDLLYIDPMPEDFSAFELGGDILEGMHPSELEQHLTGGQYQPHWQQQTMQSGGRSNNNGLVNGESNGEHQWVDHQQAGGVQRHYPDESEALNNPDTGYIGHNGFSDTYINSEAQLVTQPSEQPQNQNGHYQPQPNVPVETLVNGESSDHQFCNNFDKNHSKRMLCTSVVDKQQEAGRVKRHQPESEALNNPNNGDGTQTNQQISPEARATSRSLKEWEQHEREQ
ncbi:uncharacterized protein LOC103865874 isoform X3 [Brassica rapa]|uniref:uncharacterized protein LOC103865874 isoform X3 n=1 Tax=Brassica campestris TaxID=3711 RepID=UPI00142D7131|nr:uncharacterized protein LOC103865874 isoform X3 [Brassica rapa]